LLGRHVSRLMYETVSTDELDAVTIEGTEAEIYPVGYHLGTDESRSNVWEFDEGDSGRLHRQTEQEELYYVVEGSVNFEIGDDDLTVEEGAFVAVSPEEPRRLTACEESRVLVVGAPNVADDHVVLEDF